MIYSKIWFKKNKNVSKINIKKFDIPVPGIEPGPFRTRF